MPEGGSPEAASAIWKWRPESGPATTRARVSARLRGALQALAGTVFGAGVFFFLSTTVGYVIWGMAGLILLLALLSPDGLYALLDRLFHATGQFVGRGMTWILLPAVFYGFFVPFSLLLRRGSRDPMKRFYEPDAETYWTDKDNVRSGSDSRESQY